LTIQASSIPIYEISTTILYIIQKTIGDKIDCTETMTTRVSEISIIIPVYNEEERIERCLSRTIEYFATQAPDYEIIVAEDGSTDGTLRVIRHFQSKNKRIRLINSPERLGKGAAVRNAVFKAQKQYIGYMDCDLAADPSEFERLIKYLREGYDLAIGSRMLRGNLPKIKRPFTRSIFSFLYSILFRFLFDIPVSDPQCGFKLFKKEEVQTLLGNLETSGFAFDSEIVVKASLSGLKIREVPIIWAHDKASKIKISRQIKAMGIDLMSIWYNIHRSLLAEKGIRNYNHKINGAPRWFRIFLMIYHLRKFITKGEKSISAELET
jgi:glycosyltransferase involved in cell wall biosynthesis